MEYKQYRKQKKIYNIMDFLKLKSNLKKRGTKTAYAIYNKKQNIVKTQKLKHSTLKKKILKHRRSKNYLPTENVPKCETDDITEGLKNLSILNSNLKVVHSRRFREYCDNTTSKHLCTLVATLLRRLYYFQRRAFKYNQIKGRCRRRIVLGFREVRAHMNANKIKCVIIATDCEICNFKDGLDTTVLNLRDECKQKNVHYGFALQRREISHALFKKNAISCVGILDYDGANDIFFQMLNALESEKLNYNFLFKNIAV